MPLTCLSQHEIVEEVVVYGIRSSDISLPGTLYRRGADFLLLEVTVVNDARNPEVRDSEIRKTLSNAIAVAKKDSDIQLSVERDGFIVPIASLDGSFTISPGNRPDTSQITIRAKTIINESLLTPEKLLAKLQQFTKSIPLVGRTELIADDEPDVSIVNPHQYRKEIISMIAEDVKATTSALGDDYRVVMTGIDQPVEWVRVGPTQLAMYIPYSYQIVPTSIHSVFNSPDY